MALRADGPTFRAWRRAGPAVGLALMDLRSVLGVERAVGLALMDPRSVLGVERASGLALTEARRELVSTNHYQHASFGFSDLSIDLIANYSRAPASG